MPAVTGLGSGLDIEGLVTGLINAESVQQLALFASRTEKATSLISGFGSISSSLASLQSSLTALENADTFGAVSASSSAATYATVSADPGAAEGSYSLDVTSLAERQSLVSGDFAATTTQVGTGTLTISLGTPTYNSAPADTTTYSSFSADSSITAISVAISSGTDTLADVRDAINAATNLVTASLVKNGADYKLLLSPTDSGLAKSLSVSVTDTGDSNNTDNAGLSQLAFNSTTSNLSQARAGSDAAFSINGMSLTSSSNTLNDVIDGVDITLLQQTTSPVSLTLANDFSVAEAAVSAFVNAYNSYVSTHASLTDYNASTGISGALLGDFTARSVADKLRAELSTTIASATGTYATLSSIGVEVQTGGILKLDATKFQAAMTADRDSVQAIFVDRTSGGSTLSGLASTLDTLLDTFTSSTGTIKDRTDSIEDQMIEITTDEAEFTRRMDSLEQRYRSQFNALDSLLAEITATQDYLTTALDQLPGFVQKPKD